MGGSTLEAIVSSLIAGGLALIGVIISNMSSNKKIENQLMTAQAVTDTKLDSLTGEVRKHNDFATKIPVIEQRVDTLERDVKELKNA